MEYQEYLEAAREFAEKALNSSAPPVVIQNAHKAVEFALMVYVLKGKKRMPRDHWQTKNLAYRIDKNLGKSFAALLRMYLGAYRAEDGKRARKARRLMIEIIRRLEEFVGETILPEQEPR